MRPHCSIKVKWRMLEHFLRYEAPLGELGADADPEDGMLDLAEQLRSRLKHALLVTSSVDLNRRLRRQNDEFQKNNLNSRS